MEYRVGILADLLVIGALAFHHSQFPNAENLILAPLALPVLVSLIRWIRGGSDEALLPADYRKSHRISYTIGVFFLCIALLASVAVIPVLLDTLRGERYLYVGGGIAVISAFLFALAFSIFEISHWQWRKSSGDS